MHTKQQQTCTYAPLTHWPLWHLLCQTLTLSSDLCLLPTMISTSSKDTTSTYQHKMKPFWHYLVTLGLLAVLAIIYAIAHWIVAWLVLSSLWHDLTYGEVKYWIKIFSILIIFHSLHIGKELQGIPTTWHTPAGGTLWQIGLYCSFNTLDDLDFSGGYSPYYFVPL